ncbi:MMPL family transporter [Amycolatopsis rhizosphaerae]|uniref:MMPL family transporter n=1 Tax=Amycolatopsis rhizosphaerae TaxID=2053003 RepID=A0A558CX00_9PSEU|nr:MMPL family transporter [Amycolatopsis rhizosphaerae]TVT53289.1 MMPL family transporter [Amycolatopsis rhizosphaerae]
MSVLLYRIGRFAFTRRWWLVGGWAAVLAALTGLLLAFPVHVSNEVRIDGTPSQQVIDELAAAMPEAAGGQGMVAFRAPDGTRLDEGPGRQALVAAVDGVYRCPHVIDPRRVLAAELAKGPDSALLRATAAVAGASGGPAPGGPALLPADGRPVPGVLVSADGSVALLQFQFDVQTYELPAGTVARTLDAARAPVSGLGIRVLPGASMIEIPELAGAGEITGLAVAAIVLVITLGSVLAAGLPLIIALTGVALGVGGAFALSHVLEMHSLSAVLALMLGLAVGIDYALFIVNRERRLILGEGLDAREATARAVGTAGTAVFFAGSTVVIALAGLLVVGITLFTTMALVAAATVAIAVLAAVTLLPALLGLLGERVCSARVRAKPRTTGPKAARRPGRLVRHRHLALACALVIPAVLALPALDMKLGLPSGASYHSGTAQRQSFDAVSRAFSPGYNGPLTVVARNTVPGEAIPPEALGRVAAALRAMPGAVSVSLTGTNGRGDTAILSVIPAGGPNDEETRQLVQTLRDRAGLLERQDGVSLGTTGFTALALDVSARIAAALPVYLATVFGLSLLVLLLVFRSLVVPVKATVGFLLSVAATLGVTTAVFQWGWLRGLLGLDATAPVLSLLPIVVTGVLYGLAMDYQVFLVSSIREARVHGETGHRAITSGFATAGRVVTAAAIIMISVFAGFAFNADPMVVQVGFALAVGILVDAFLVRMTLVPAVLAIVGERAWWIPRRLDRVLPRLDLEGDRLLGRLRGERPSGAQAPVPADHP